MLFDHVDKHKSYMPQRQRVHGIDRAWACFVDRLHQPDPRLAQDAVQVVATLQARIIFSVDHAGDARNALVRRAASSFAALASPPARRLVISPESGSNRLPLQQPLHHHRWPKCLPDCGELCDGPRSLFDIVLNRLPYKKNSRSARKQHDRSQATIGHETTTGASRRTRRCQWDRETPAFSLRCCAASSLTRGTA